MEKTKGKKFGNFFKILLIVVCIFVFVSIVWVVFSLIGRVDAGAVIPDSAALRVTVPNTIRLIDGVLSHGSLDDIVSVPALAQAVPVINTFKESPLLKNRVLRLAARGKLEFALLENETLAAAYDLGFFSPLLRILPVISGFIKIPNLNYVLAGNNSRFEFRAENMTLFIGRYRNLLFITNNLGVYESCSAQAGGAKALKNIEPSAYDAVFLLSHEYIYDLLAEQDPRIAAILDNVEFDSMIEAGLSIDTRKLEFRLETPLSSDRPALSRFLESRSKTPDMAEHFPASAQYATILSAGTLQEIYQTALVFGPDLDDTLRQADRSSRTILGLSLDDLLFSWSGKEFAVFGMEGRPHPVFAIQVSDERKRQEVFDKAFRSVFINEDVRLNLDGMRMPRIATPEFLQSLLRRWDIYLPSPYYTIYKDFLLISESADTLLSALRAMQRNDVLPRTAAWRNIAGGRVSGGFSAESAFSLYYSLDLPAPFFLRKNTTLSAFLSLYRQGLIRISFDRGIVGLSISLVPGSGGGVTLAGGYPIDVGGMPSNQLYGTGKGGNGRVFFTSGGSAFSVDLADNSIRKLDGQNANWVIPAGDAGARNAVNAWAVSDRGRVTLVDGGMEPVRGFPVLTGLRLSAPPRAFEGRLYLCDEDGKVRIVDERGNQSEWETSFIAALRSPPSFLAVPARGRNSGGSYAAVYPKSFFGEIWLLDTNGSPLPNWPAPVSAGNVDDGFAVNTGIGFGSPLLFAHNNRVYIAFVCQTGELVLYDENAVPVSPFPLYLNGVFYLQPVFDGEYLWLVSSEGTLFRVSLEGELLYQQITDLSVMEEGYLTTFDCDGDKVPEVFITGEGNALYAFTRGFRSLEGFPLPVWGRPHFVEAQGSMKAEVFGMGMDRRLYRWQFR